MQRIVECASARKRRYEHIWVGVSWQFVWRAIVLSLFALLGIAPNSAAVLAQATDTHWEGSYWDNPSLIGSPVVSRQDEALDFDWGAGSPATDIPANRFSARWERNINVTAGDYLFTAVADDGIRLWVDGRLLINAWTEQAATSYEVGVFLSQGQHFVRVEYYELIGDASISVSWRPVSDIPDTYWRGEYFNNSNLDGAPQVVRNDARIGFDWGAESPLPDINQDGFSVRWSRNLSLPTGYYRFTARVDDGIRLFVQGDKVIDAWESQAVSTYSEVIYLQGSVTVQMEYYEETGLAEAHLSWQMLDGPPTATPTSTPMPTPTPTSPPTTGVWHAQYWNNRSFSGDPALVQQESVIDYNWGSGSPSPQRVNQDDFSVRWSRILYLPAGYYRFTVRVDDGVRLFVKDDTLIDAWKMQSVATYSGDIYLDGNPVTVRMEYYEETGLAEAHLSWQRLDGPPTATPTPISTTATTATTDVWQAQYWNNRSFSGDPALVQQESVIDYNWGSGSPSPQRVNQDNFSVRWSRNLHLPAGYYRFTVRVDDGVRLFVKDRTLIDAWTMQSVVTHSGDIYLDGNPVTVRMEYYEETGLAEAHLSWQRLDGPTPTPPTPSLTGTVTPTLSTPGVWHAQYWNNRSFSGDPALVQQESVIDYNWGSGSPSPQRVNQDDFSVRWTGQFSLDPGSYRFDIAADDGVRLYINGLKQIDGWRDQPVTSYQTTFTHDGGPLHIVLEYYDHTELARIRLSWRASSTSDPTPSPSPQPTPDDIVVLVDDLSAGFQRGGLESTWRQTAVGHETHSFWTQNNDRVRSGNNWGRWSPQLDADVYEVFVYIPGSMATTRQARYWISHAGGFTLRVVNQSLHADQWVSLGTYLFRGVGQDYVSLSDVTYESYLSRMVAWDAMKWEKR